MPPVKKLRYSIEYDPTVPVSRFTYTNDEGIPAQTIVIETDKTAGTLRYAKTGKVQDITPQDLDLILEVFGRWLARDAVGRIGIPLGVDANEHVHYEADATEDRLQLSSGPRSVEVTHFKATNLYEIDLSGGGPTPTPSPMTAWRGNHEIVQWKARQHKPFIIPLPSMA